ncbi:hypothetical protein PAMA_014715 [Pampus argenteus]
MQRQWSSLSVFFVVALLELGAADSVIYPKNKRERCSCDVDEKVSLQDFTHESPESRDQRGATGDSYSGADVSSAPLQCVYTARPAIPEFRVREAGPNTSGDQRGIDGSSHVKDNDSDKILLIMQPARDLLHHMQHLSPIQSDDIRH